jgi:hypothetical protein
MPHIVVFFYKMSFPSTSFILFGEDEMFWDPSITFLLPSCVKAQAQTLASLALLPSWIVFQGYDPKVRSYINDKALKDV